MKGLEKDTQMQQTPF